MKILPEAITVLKDICGEQKEKPGAYRRTTLCVTVPCDEGVLLFHTLTGVLLLLEDQSEWETMRAELIKNWFLVPEPFDEPAFADRVFSVAALLGQKKTAFPSAFTVLTTTDCNARCYYCYEAGVRKCTMTAQTAHRAADYISRASGEVSLHWFGGEPLLNTAAIDIICSDLAQKGIPFHSKMTSNGYLLDENAVQKAKSLWNLKSIQITLDGKGDAYDRVKAYVGAPRGAFDRVMRHIDYATDNGLTVNIRLNVGKHNLPELAELGTELANRFSNKNNLNVYTSLLGDFQTENGRLYAESMTAQQYYSLKKTLADAGFSEQVKPLPREWKVNACMADNDEAEIILPDGRLCRCEHVSGQETYGSIDSPEREQQIIQSWKERVKMPECYSCALYPRCVCLKRCAWVGTNCSQLMREIRKKGLTDQIIATYNQKRGE